MIAGVFYRHHRKSSGDEFGENLKATLNNIQNRNKHSVKPEYSRHAFSGHLYISDTFSGTGQIIAKTL